MIRDVFYYGQKPNVHPKEKFAKNLADARKQSKTEHFWIINEFCDYKNFDWDFDFEFLPDQDVWAQDHNNVWPSVHQKDSGTWLCPKQHSDVIVYRNDVDPLKRYRNISSNWKILENIDKSKWDFSWHPDPTDPPYIYKWGCKYFPVELRTCLEYHVPGATDVKYMRDIVELLPNWDLIVETQQVDQSKWDMSWRPDPLDPPYIYVWGNKFIDGRLKSTLEYHTPGATEKKYMANLIPVLPEWENWKFLHNVDKASFDFTWRPDPREPDFIYVFGNDQYDGTIMPTIEYHMPNATVRKYVSDIKAKLLPDSSKFQHLEDSHGIDYSWVPDPTSPPYIYAWGNQWNKPEDKISIQYVVEGATEYKYMNERAIRKPCMVNWEIPNNIDTTGFDFSWEPSPADPAYIYEFGTQHQKTGGPRYVVPGATEVKYIDIQKVKALPTTNNWTIPSNLDITGFDFSWHPDSTSPPYIYHFATQWALTGGPIYTVSGATEVKYLDSPSAIALPNKSNWVYDASIIDETSFDFSWHPYVEDQPYIYQFGTQHQKTGGPKYVTPGALSTSPTKYIDTRILKALRLSRKDNFAVLNNYKIKDFDYSWHPDDTEEPYIYVFGNTQYPAEIMPTIEYAMPGAKQIKYVTNVVATLDVDMTNWDIPKNVDTTGFDFSWKPNPKDPPYIYQFGTQHQKTGGPRYVVPGATEVKYILTQQVKQLPNKKKFKVVDKLVIDTFDYSWHPDDTDEPYIYVFGNNQYPAEIMPTIEYRMPGATQIKYVSNVVAKLGVDKKNWIIPKNVDTTGFDFSWKPNPKDPAYTYQFGTQWQKTGGPRYVVPGATEVKYIDTMTVKSLPNKKQFTVINKYKIKQFDYSWHPDDTDTPYIYVFGNNQYPAEIMPTIEYRVEGATQIKYVNTLVATLDIDKKHWVIPKNVDIDGFDFSWKPNPKDPALIYEFGTQWQKTGGPRYVVPGATEVKYVSTQKVKALPNREHWTVPANIDISGFDFSWHPDSTSPPYIYHFATQWALTGGPIYHTPNATEKKYLEEPSVVALPNRENWEIPNDIDVNSFDFSWHPYVEDQPYIYQFGTQHQKTGGPKYITPGVIPTSPTKYIDTRILKAKKLANKNNFAVLNNYKIKDFDWSWHPDETEEPYIYIFGNNQYPAEIMPTIEYAMPGAKQIKYINDVVATLDVDMSNWSVPSGIDISEFDFSWKPHPFDPPLIYQFGTQHQKTGGPRYTVFGATKVKYVGTPRVKNLSKKEDFSILNNLVIESFDYSWHPDETEEPYIYVFGNNQYPAEIMPTIEYAVPGAKTIKYINDVKAKLGVDKKNWVIPDGIDVSNFDFSWKPNPKDPAYIYQFSTQHQKTGGPRYIVPGATEIKYVDSNGTVIALPQKDKFITVNNYKIKDFDYSWHPDDTEEPYIYVFGNTQHPAEIMPTIEYRMSGATETKYVHDIVATLGEDRSNWVITQPIDESKFDFSWKPNPKDPAYIYRWGNKYISNKFKPTIEYHVSGATDIKYMDDNVEVVPEWDYWKIPEGIDTTGFDFSWRPDPLEPNLIWQFGTQWQKTGGPRYVAPDATEIKYVSTQKVKKLPTIDKWIIPDHIDVTGFDFSWHPDDTSPPYIYQFGTQWALTGGPKYIIEGATEIKYLDAPSAIALPNKANWKYDSNLIDADSFDFSWHPYVEDQPYIYQFGTQHQKTGGPKYITPGALSTSPIKYIDTRIIKSTRLPNKRNFAVLNNYKIKDFDWSWHPDDTEEPYIYVFGNTQHPAEIMPTIEYAVPGAKQIKYVSNVVATLGADMTNWKIPTDIDATDFDFSWKPNPKDPPYIYQFGTQWQKTGGPRYVVPGATEVKYVDTMKVKKLADSSKFTIVDNLIVDSFDYSWHPDDTDEPYIYVFGNNLYPSTLMPTIEYRVEGASQVKHIDSVVATLGIDKSNWEIPENVDASTINFYWKPNPKDPAYIYQFGTQHQKTGGPRYVVPGATDVKYIDSPKSTALPVKENFAILDNLKIKDFDYSWHPDGTDTPYIYIFGNNQYPAEIMPTIEYRVEGAKQIKYVQNVIAILDADMSNWEIPDGIEVTDFDFSWKPNPKDPAYIYEFGTQWQKTGGPRYVVPGATEVKYVTTQKAKALPTKNNWNIPAHVDTTNFDFSWHPDATSPPYIYHFATQWALTGGPVYNMEGATEIKYVEFPSAVALPNRENWEIPNDIDVDNFDFSWHPYVEDQPYVYQFGTQWQKTGGPKYITPGVVSTSPIKYIDTRIISAKKLANKNNFAVLNNYKIKEFDWSWHPDETEEPFIYVFGNTQHPSEIMPTIEYAMPGAKQVKYINDVVATLDVDMSNWEVPENIDTSECDFSWKPNPKDPPFIYQFGTQWQKTGGPRYVVPGATEVKYVSTFKAKALPTKKNWTIPDNLDITGFDFSWHPDDTSPAYIYHFATQWALTGGPIYTVSGATETKYLDEPSAIALPNKTNWEIPDDIDADSFDFSWHPYIEDQPYVYQFGTQWQKTGGPKYITPGVLPTSPVKYIDTRILKSTKKSNKNNFAILNNYKIKDFDYSWHPDETEEPFIYIFGNNQYPAEIMPTIEYAVPGAKQVKYINDVVATLDVDMSNWEIPDNVDTTDFDFRWKPNPKDPPYIYQFGTQWQKTGGPRYIVAGATEVKYIEGVKVKALPTKDNWTIPSNLDITGFDFSWHPDATSPPYIYHFATQWALTGGPIYTVPGATETKYLEEPSAIALSNKDNWEIPADIDASKFDFSWHPYVEDQPYIYVFGTQHQKTGGPKYITPGVIPTSPIKFIDTRILKAEKLPNRKNFAILNNYKIKDFDWSWHPDDTEEPFIYIFGNNQYPAEIMPTIEYAMPGAKAIKYISDIVATLDVDMSNWEIPDNVDISGFDFSWKPNPKDPAYIYEFSTQWQKTGGPRYVVPGATEVKYVTTQQVKALPTTSNWELPRNVDVTDFDFSWHPDSTSPPYIYHFATQWALSGGPVYKVPGATEVKYMEQPSAKALPNKENWEVPADIDSANFDFSWHPYVEDQPYIYQFGTQWQKTGGPKYITPGVVSTSPTKYIDTRILKATKLSNRNNFTILNNYKIKDFDYSWHPDDTEEPFIYVFGNNQYPAEIMPTIEYAMPGAKQVKYVNSIVATLDDDRTNWEIPEGIDVSNFDFSWKPNPKDPAFIYQFGTQWQKTGGPRYVVPGATQVKYIDGSKAKSLPNRRNWILPKDIPIEEFDFSWHPDTTEDAYIYVFGTQWVLTGGPRYIVEGATEYKYMDVNFAKVGPTSKNWVTPSNLVIKDFDYSWHPHPDDPMFIYQFGTQWHDRGGPQYVVTGANKDTPVKYIDTRIIKATLGPNKNNWEIPAGIDVSKFDFSWVPHPDDPPYIYEFGTQWQKTSGPRYVVAGATEIKYIDGEGLRARRLPNKKYWFNPYKADVTTFDYSWHPDDTSPPYIYQFGSEEGENDGPRYIVPGATGDVIYLKRVELAEVPVEEPVVEDVSTSTIEEPVIEKPTVEIVVEEPVEKCDIFLVDRGNPETQSRFEYLKAKFGNVQKTRYLNSWVDTINRCINRSSTDLCWILNSELDYTDFDFNYYPNPYQMKMVHVFGTQWSHWGTTFMVNRNTFSNDTKWIKIIEHLSNLNFVKSQYVNRLAKATNCLYDIYVVDHGNSDIHTVNRILTSKASGKSVTSIKYQDNYFDTLKNLLSTLPEKKEHYIWLCSSICDYANFDFTYICDPFAREQLHVFPSNKQKFGDTFLINVNRLRELIDNMENLKSYDKINYNQHQQVQRFDPPKIVTEFDSHVASVMEEFDFPYAVFVTEDNKDITVLDEEPMSLWENESKNILITSTGGTRIIVPKEAKQYVETQLYDYPYIKTSTRLAKSNPLDIVYLSNGEKCAEENYEHLLKITKGLPNRIVRVDGVNGRVQAYHAAAEASNTSWMFTVFAKLKVNPKFDFNWQPDRLQIPKHYMFLAKNPVNGLIYGHQGMIAYNKQMTLDNQGTGLDFTLDSPHETIELLSGIATFNTDEWSTWRTAFREAIKLKKENTEISLKRLNVWLTKAEGDFAEYSIQGAQEGVAYFDKVKGDIAKLRLSYEWDWLQKQFKKKKQ